MASPRIDRDLLKDTAFDLLSSSTVSRFTRCAMDAAEKGGLTDSVKTDHKTVSSLTSRAQSLFNSLYKKNKRDAEEVEVAIILAALARASEKKASDLLDKIAAHKPNSGTIWIHGLAIELQKETTAARSA